MSDVALTLPEHELRMLAPLVECAHALALRFGEAARAEPDMTKSLRLADAFHKSFQAFRFGIRLNMALRDPPRPTHSAPERPETLETERPEREPLETESLERFDVERERDYEPVSLPRFLATLRGVAAGAAHPDMPADVRADAAKLRGLLARADAAPAPAAARPSAGVALLTRPSPAGRSALLGSATPTLLSPILPRPPPRRSG